MPSNRNYIRCVEKLKFRSNSRTENRANPPVVHTYPPPLLDLAIDGTPVVIYEILKS